MNDPRDILRQGNLQDALTQLKQDVRKAPRDPRLRTFLFQLFCITGEWERALTQASVASELDPAAKAMADTYRVLIRCEILREKVFAGERLPTVFGDPGDWVPLLIEANRLLASGKADEAALLRDKAFDAAPELAVTVNGTPAEWIADADPRLGPIVEAVVEGRYMWIPFSRIKEIRSEPPVDVRDQVWMPVSFIWTNEGEVVGFIPTRYPGSATSANPAVQLARLTDWQEVSPDWSVPIGQRVWMTDADETALMDIRRLTIAAADVVTHSAGT